jgi:hypothetical protein
LKFFEGFLVLKIFVLFEFLTVLGSDFVGITGWLYDRLTIDNLNLTSDLLVCGVKLLVQIVFKFDGLMHSFDDLGQIDLSVLR